jgi:ABC-type amino acid transport substrate-binding protein
MEAIVKKKFDMALTSLKVNAEREAAVDFTAPFLESGSTILVAKRTGIISPTAFLGMILFPSVVILKLN